MTAPNILFPPAALFAIGRHANQIRRYTGEPYWHHPAEVASLLPLGTCQDMISAAWMHDLIEDTDTTRDEIQQEFGDRVASLVWYLTEERVPGQARPARCHAYNLKLGAAPKDAQDIKLRDIQSNIRSIASHDPHFALTYIPEKMVTLEHLTKADLVELSLTRRACIMWLEVAERTILRDHLRNRP